MQAPHAICYAAVIVGLALSPACSDGLDTDAAMTSIDRDELREAMQRLDAYYRAPEGLGRPQGCSIDGRPDFESIAAWVFDVYLNARRGGLDIDTAWRNVVASIEASEEWRAKHPGQQPSTPFTPFPPVAPLSRDEFLWILERLDSLYMSDYGLGRVDGLSIDGRPDFEGIAAWGFDVYLNARLEGQSVHRAWDRVLAAIAATAEWQSRPRLPVDRSSLYGKHLVGYQGWFGAPGDGVHGTWVHWFGGAPRADAATFDVWPDVRELEPDELYPTEMTARTGGPALLFSSQHPRTVARHFAWMRDAGIDGVSLGRFTAGTRSDPTRTELDNVARNVKAGAEAAGRVFFVWYDVTGHPADTFVEDIKRDWRHLVDDLALTASPAHLYHEGKPLVGVWGMGAGDRPGTPEQWIDLLRWFRENPDPRYRATLLVGGIPDWRTNPTWSAAFREIDVVSPWTVGAFGDDAGADAFLHNVIEPDLRECEARGIDYLPIAFPGFSWHNLQDGTSPVNAVPRRSGRFYWHQIHNIVSANARVLFTAMFDEVDEGTAILKAAPTAGLVPMEGEWLTLDADGDRLPSDWYLKLAGAGGKMLRGEIPRTPEIPVRR